MAPDQNNSSDTKDTPKAEQVTQHLKYSWRYPPSQDANSAPSQTLIPPTRPDSAACTDASFMTTKTHFSNSESADSTAPATTSSTQSSLLPSAAEQQSEPEIFDPNACELEQNCTILQTSKGNLVWPGRLTNAQLALTQLEVAEREANEEGRTIGGFDIEDSMRRTKAEREEEYKREDARELLERQRRELQREIEKQAKKDSEK